jgi:hypothetical protein
VLAINRSPCHSRCSQKLATAIRLAKLRGKANSNDSALPNIGKVDFVLAASGTYEPTDEVSEAEQERYRAELEKQPGMTPALLEKALVKEQFRTDHQSMADITRDSDLVLLESAGWDLRLLRTSKKTTDHGAQWLMGLRRAKQRVAEVINKA